MREQRAYENSPRPFRLCFNILISTAGGAGVIIWVEPFVMISLFAFLLDTGLHLHFNLFGIHNHIQRFRFRMYRACKGSYPGFFLLRSRLALWDFLLFHCEFAWRLWSLPIASLAFVLVSTLSISCSAVCPLGVTGFWGVSLRGGRGALCIRAVVTS